MSVDLNMNAMLRRGLVAVISLFVIVMAAGHKLHTSYKLAHVGTKITFQHSRMRLTDTWLLVVRRAHASSLSVISGPGAPSLSIDMKQWF